MCAHTRRAFLGVLGAVGATTLMGCARQDGVQMDAEQDLSAHDINLPNEKRQSEHLQSIATQKDCLAHARYDFFGMHQAGIDTPMQRNVYFLVADLHSTDKKIIAKMFADWTDMSARLTQGQSAHDRGANKFVPPTDTGEVQDLGAYGLTLAFGISPSFLQKLGLDDKAPKDFVALPKFAREQLRENLTGGDLCILAQSDDAQVCFHAVRQLVRHARANITMKWAQAGFVGADGAHTPRNLFAFKDGTANVRTPADAIWFEGAPNWFDGGTYLVARIIAMHLETWDRTSLKAQEDTFARHRDTGAPLGGHDEFEEFTPQGAPDNAHTSLAHATGKTMLRRGYSYNNGIDATGQFDAGLLFLSFQRDLAQFIDIQNALGRDDKMNEYTTHIGSGMFALFGGVKKGRYLGQDLFA